MNNFEELGYRKSENHDHNKEILSLDAYQAERETITQMAGNGELRNALNKLKELNSRYLVSEDKLMDNLIEIGTVFMNRYLGKDDFGFDDIVDSGLGNPKEILVNIFSNYLSNGAFITKKSFERRGDYIPRRRAASRQFGAGRSRSRPRPPLSVMEEKFDLIKNNANRFGITKNDIAAILKESLSASIWGADRYRTLELASFYENELSPDELAVVLEDSIISLLKQKDIDIDVIIKLQESFSLAKSVIESERIIRTAAQVLESKQIRDESLDRVIKIKTVFNTPVTSTIQKNILEMITDHCSHGGFAVLAEAVEVFDISQEEIHPVLEKALSNLISEGKFFDDIDDDKEDDESKPNDISVSSLLKHFPDLKSLMNLDSYQSKIQKGFLALVATGDITHITKALNQYAISRETLEAVLKNTFTNRPHNYFDICIFLNNVTEKPLDPRINKTVAIFGNFANYESYQTIKNISENVISDELRQFGVKQGGETGLLQLEQALAVFKSQMLKPDFDPASLSGLSFKRDYFKNQIRFNIAEWKGVGSAFDYMLERYINITKNPEYDIAPLNPEFTPSEIIHVDTVDKESKPAAYTESFLSRFKTIKIDIERAKQQYLSKNPLSGLVSTLDEKRIAIIEELEKKILSIPNERGKQALAERIELLKGLQLRNLKDFQKNFLTLSNFKELESELRQAMFVMGFAKNRGQLGKDIRSIDIEAPALDDITWVLNFVDHIVNKETMGQYFTDKQARNKFRDLISIKALEEELSRFNNQEITGTLPMQFIPTRGILMEFSGHIADACWADKYEETIPATFPNFTAVTMVQNPKSKYERLCGSCVLIETHDAKAGQPLLVIRGLNPIEGTINQLAPQDFYEKFTQYAQSLAEKTGRKLAIVIDNHSGGSATNRPVLFKYLHSLITPSPVGDPRGINGEEFEKKKSILQKVIVPYDETEFNGYDITDHVYLVE